MNPVQNEPEWKTKGIDLDWYIFNRAGFTIKPIKDCIDDMVLWEAYDKTGKALGQGYGIKNSGSYNAFRNFISNTESCQWSEKLEAAFHLPLAIGEELTLGRFADSYYARVTISSSSSIRFADPLYELTGDAALAVCYAWLAHKDRMERKIEWKNLEQNPK